MKYLEEIAAGVRFISSGDLSYRVEEKGKDEIKNLAENINNMASEIQERMEAERRAEKTKSELITNVSHDLRTPLTSVMGYIGLIKAGKYEDENMMKEYLDIAFNKSNQLKELIEDLFNIVDIHTKCDSRQTNADIIRNMSYEELGDLLQSVSSGVENGSPFISLCVDDNETTINFSDISEWLKSEAE